MRKINISEADFNIIKRVFEVFHADLNAWARPGYKPVSLSVIQNPDGSVRWVWPTQNYQPDFLKFYHVSDIKGLCFSLAVRIIFFLRLQRLVFKRVILHTPITQVSHFNYLALSTSLSIFTGTPGVYRKAVCFQKLGPTGQFVKIGLTPKAGESIMTEYINLKYWPNIKSIKVPTIINYDKGVLTISDVKKIVDVRPRPYSTALANYQNQLDEWLVKTPLFESKIWRKIDYNFKLLQLMDHTKIPFGIKSKLFQLKASISNVDVAFAPGHGDFTPWNCWVNKKRIALYDLEFASKELPRYYDLIHFHLQDGILVKRKNGGQLIKEIANFLINLGAKQEEIKTSLTIYMLSHVSHSLAIYNDQENWHVQIHWLINTWNEVLSHLLSKKEQSRLLVLSDVLDTLHPQQHALLKAGNNPYALNEYADLDIAINRENTSSVIAYLSDHPLVEKVVINKQSFMLNLECYTKDNGFLSIDLLWEFKRKYLTIIPKQEFLSNTVKTKTGLQRPAPINDLKYTWWFYLLNGTSVPKKYDSRIEELIQANPCQQLITDLNLAATERNIMHYQPEVHQKVTGQLLQENFNHKWNLVKNKYRYMTDAVSSFFTRKGFMVTFTGVDGAGKTTIIGAVKNELEKKYRKKVVVLRHRPGLLPILSAWVHGKEKAEAMSVAKLPRQGANKNTFSSLIRFGYYYIDYLVGQWLVHFKYIKRGYIVLYDRYYFDFINDGKRSNINLPKGLVYTLFTFVRKPQFNFFLYADAELILSRKKELSEEVIVSLTNGYKELFSRLSNRYKKSLFLPVNNLQLQTTKSTIINNIQPRLK